MDSQCSVGLWRKWIVGRGSHSVKMEIRFAICLILLVLPSFALCDDGGIPDLSDVIPDKKEDEDVADMTTVSSSF